MFILIGKKSHCSIKFGLYRDDGLAVFKNVSEPATEKMKIYTFFSNKKASLQIIECSLKVVIYIYLIVTFNLNDHFYRPYRTPNDKTHCYHIHSDPPTIHKQTTFTVHWKKVAHVIITKTDFDKIAPYYEKRLVKSSYKKH